MRCFFQELKDVKYTHSAGKSQRSSFRSSVLPKRHQSQAIQDHRQRRPVIRKDSHPECGVPHHAQEKKGKFQTQGKPDVLPDHLHCIWRLPEGDSDYSKRWRIIKGSFTHWFRSKGNDGRIWQNRFWEHTIRDDEDFARHFDYIHYNPVKHALVDRPAKWEFSTFHKYFEKEWYSEDWGSAEPENLKNMNCVGE